MKTTTNHYDVIIIGTGAGGGTLAHRLAPTGKKILVLERGDFLPREKDNWSARKFTKRNAITLTNTGTAKTVRRFVRRLATGWVEIPNFMGQRCYDCESEILSK